jgi:hypothetical protein
MSTRYGVFWYIRFIEAFIHKFTARPVDIGHRTSDIRQSEAEDIALHVIQLWDILQSTPNREAIRGYET